MVAATAIGFQTLSHDAVWLEEVGSIWCADLQGG
jgi:hypothetical protein